MTDQNDTADDKPEHQGRPGLAPVFAELNKRFPDGAIGATGPKASSEGLLRATAFARESLTHRDSDGKE